MAKKILSKEEKEQFESELDKIIERENERDAEIKKKARADGTWRPIGLDSYSDLLRSSHMQSYQEYLNLCKKYGISKD